MSSMPLVLVAVKSALTLRNPAGHARFLNGHKDGWLNPPGFSAGARETVSSSRTARFADLSPANGGGPLAHW
jgi:hypothetical protein